MATFAGRLTAVERRYAAPAAAVRYVPPVSFARDAGLDPDDWQEEVLLSDAPRIAINASRQSGKSTIVATMAVHTAVYTPGSLVLLLSPSLRQSGLLFQRCSAIYNAVERPVPATSETALTLTLLNGSRIVSLPGTRDQNIRGFSGVNLLAIDEASRVRDDLYLSCRPMLAVSGGRLVTMSTPFGTRGWWFEAWRSEEAWERYEVPATECPRIPASFLEEEQRTMGDWWYRQEYLCEFLDGQTQAFTRDDIDRCFAEEVEPWSFTMSA